ncbi:unnamed protein product [Closterium sp. NIES-53]
MATSTSTLVGNLIILYLAPNGTSTNFGEWCYGVEKHLLSSELKGICLKDILLNRGKGKIPLPPDPLGEGATAIAKLAFDAKTTKYETDFSLWEQADAAVIRVFITTTPVELVKSYRTFRSTHDIWKYLQDRFHDKTAVGVAILIPRMFQIRLEECPGMADYISEIRNIHEELKDIGITFPEQAPAAGLLVGLTPAYNVTSSMLKQLPTKELTFEKVFLSPQHLHSARRVLPQQTTVPDFHAPSTTPAPPILYRIRTVTPPPSLYSPSDSYLRRLGHINFRALSDLATKQLLHGLPASLPQPPSLSGPPCLDCAQSKFQEQPHPPTESTSTAPLDRVHIDLWGPAPVRSRGGHFYFLVIVDDYSRYVSVHLLTAKSEAPAIIMERARQAHSHFKTKIKILHSDGGGEFRNNTLKAFCSTEGIRQTFTLPDSPQQNGVAESRNRILVQIARCLLTHASAPPSLWGYAMLHAAALHNLHPHPHHTHTTPAELWLLGSAAGRRRSRGRGRERREPHSSTAPGCTSRYVGAVWIAASIPPATATPI